ncbi:hypothetical protein AVEN_264132-1 [Araneus ventricosus]|uniref:Uncharacterized protein n=1 Tax=Araneus ventricosus TaxID=182803 RepID=A0A4Y2UZP9_ARAVE|nr:hypothetical protein AVEN_264132-1 [Araneus ventricosus]
MQTDQQSNLDESGEKCDTFLMMKRDAILRSLCVLSYHIHMHTSGTTSRSLLDKFHPVFDKDLQFWTTYQISYDSFPSGIIALKGITPHPYPEAVTFTVV